MIQIFCLVFDTMLLFAHVGRVGVSRMWDFKFDFQLEEVKISAPKTKLSKLESHCFRSSNHLICAILLIEKKVVITFKANWVRPVEN